MTKLEYNLNKVDEMYKFKKNWNLYGAEPIPKGTLNLTKKVLKELTMQPEVFPTGASTIQLEYEKGNNYLEIELYKNNLNVFLIDENREESFSIKAKYRFKKIDSIVDYINFLIEEYVKGWCKYEKETN